jgi:hypothetical protein
MKIIPRGKGCARSGSATACFEAELKRLVVLDRMPVPSYSLRASIAAVVLMVACGCFSFCGARTLPVHRHRPFLPRSQPIPLSLTHRSFPPQPGPAAAAWIPQSFDTSAPWILIVHFHGFHNCVMNAVGNVSTSCTLKQPARVAYSLGQQLDASAANALLLLPEGDS